MGLTDDPTDTRLRRGVSGPTGQNEIYLILSEEERAKGFVRPLRRSYSHVRGIDPCHRSTHMGLALCETYARDPKFYGATFCVECDQHYPVDQFDWDEDGEMVGS